MLQVSLGTWNHSDSKNCNTTYDLTLQYINMVLLKLKKVAETLKVDDTVAY
jgi:hypothetical protein